MELIDTVIWSLMDLILVCIIFFLFDSLLLGYKYISFEILIGLFCETEDRLHIYAKRIVYLLSLSVSLCVSLCAFLSLCLSHSFCVSFSFSLYLSLSLRVCVSVCLSPPPSPYVFFSLFLCVSVFVSVCQSVFVSVCQSVFAPFLSVCVTSYIQINVSIPSRLQTVERFTRFIGLVQRWRQIVCKWE